MLRIKDRMLKQFFSNQSFTLVEVMISCAIAAVAFAGLFSVYYQSTRILTSMRQTSRAEDICLANLEFLRTRSWDQLTNVYTTTSATTPSQSSSNLIESINMVVTSVTNSPVCTHLEIINGDPLRIGLIGAKRDFVFAPNIASSATSATIVTGTVIVSWETYSGTRLTNSMTTVITKQGMTAD